MRQRLAVGTAVAATLVLAAPAHALTSADLERLANSRAPEATGPGGGAYADPLGDNERLGPDLADVAVSNDPAGRVSVRVGVPNVPQLRQGHFFALFLDTDGRAATGSRAALGADYAVAFDGTTGTADLARWVGGAWSFAVAKTSFRALWSAGASVDVHRNELGGTTGFNFWAGGMWTDWTGRYGDIAPDAGTWSYTLGGLDATAPRGPELDSRPPRVRAVASRGQSGRIVSLRYRVLDERGETRARVRVLRGRRAVATFDTAFAPAGSGALHVGRWYAPPAARGRYRFCVQAWDRAGNGSAPSCAPLRLRGR